MSLIYFHSNWCANSCTEFHRHKTADNPVHVMGFLLEWKRYLDKIQSQSSKDGPFRGEKMDSTVFEKVWGFHIVVSCIRNFPKWFTLSGHSYVIFTDEQRTARTAL